MALEQRRHVRQALPSLWEAVYRGKALSGLLHAHHGGGETEPCNIVVPKKAFSKRLTEYHTLKTYNRVYKTIYTRMKRGSISVEEFNTWKTEARQLLEKTRSGEMKEEEFTDWLPRDIRAWSTMNRTDDSVEQHKRLGE